MGYEDGVLRLYGIEAETAGGVGGGGDGGVAAGGGGLGGQAGNIFKITKALTVK